MTWNNLAARLCGRARRAVILLGVCYLGPALALGATSGQCTPTLPFEDGWWGADAAYSIPLPDGRSVWIFGDTLYGEKRVVESNQPRMVRNSVGVSRCTGKGEWQLQYAIRLGPEGQPQDFFEAETKRTWYWALDGFVHGKDLWVTLLCVRSAREKRLDGFDFETCGADLAKISDLDGDPQKWKVAYFPLVTDGVAAYPSSTALVDGEYTCICSLCTRRADGPCS